ncbi:winged helix DNA-binding domain-containing protein [Nocardioides sp. R-C-SC26]|uniref:winged helix DNA-binding domain-containing protein n=1 Tax=Nocardioides sp. R-C-SC26 TaxID=2870414 RepID=UPI001E5C1F07|nr:winged helix DNA-binding domain-containing protein [Nocardioides sp. R-C-SC26]
MRHVTDDERRRRLARRHALTPGARLAAPEQITEALVVLHATEPATVYLSCWSRSDAVTIVDVDRALYRDRTLVKQLSMRRTLFVYPRDLLPAAWGSAAARTAGTEGARLAKEIAALGITDDAAEWVDRARAEVLGLLADEPDGLAALAIRRLLPQFDVALVSGAGSSISRLLTHLGATADVVRAANDGHWRVSRPRWIPTSRWLGEVPQPWSVGDGYRELVRRWLAQFGPGTEDDLVWWLGATKSVVRAALAELDVVEVGLDDGARGWVLPDDVDPEPPVEEPWVALLPVLDPTMMGWRGRDFYLGAHGPALFDRNGNAGTTAWVDGRAVGCWVQDTDAVVRVHLLEDVGAEAVAALEGEAARLTAWLDGERVGTVYPSPAMKEARDGT